MSMAFLETLIKWEESSPLDVARALREADAFAAHHEDLARYARGLAGRIAQETGGFTGDEFSLDSSAPQSPTKDFPRSPPTPKRKAPLSPLAGGPLPLGLPPRRAGAAAGPNPYDLDSPDVASYASLEHRIERRASFDRCSEERASFERERRGSRRSDHDDALGAASRERRGGRCVRWMHHVDLFVDVFFLADIALTFFTSYVDEVTAEEVTDRRCIAYRYVFDPFAGKWIVFDAIASLPTSFFGCAGGGILEYVKFIRFTKLFKMLRMLKINSIVDTRHMPFFHPVMMRFMRILLGLLFVWHLFACLYWRVARSEEYWSTGCDPAAFSCWIPPKRVRDAPFFRQYSYAPPRVPRAYLWGSIHSFGSVFAVPTTTRTMWTTASVAIVGLVVNAIVIGSATNVLDGFHSIAKQHQKRKDGVNHYMRWQNFPPETVRRANDFLDYQWATGTTVDGAEVMRDMPPPLQLEMRMCLNRKIIDTQPLFWELGPKLMMVLVTALKAHITTPNETILREGDHGDLLFFLVHGEALAYCDGDEGDRKKALLRAAKARVARRRLLAAKGGVIAGKPLAREAALLHEVLRRNTNGVRGAEDEHFAPPPARGPRATTINGLGRRVDAGGLRGGSGPPGSSPPAGWRRQLQSSDGPAADDGDRRDGVARKTLMRTMTDTVKFVLRSRSFKNQSLDRVGVVHGDAYVAEEARDDGGGDDDDYQHVILLSVLKIGAVIGEIALLSEDEKRTASVLTTQHCELYSLDAENFNFIRSSHAEWHEILVHSAEQRVTWSKQMKALVNDDVSPDDAAAVEHANNFLAKRRATASRVVAPFHATSTTIKRDGQSHWDYMKQTKVAPTLSAAGDMLRNSSRGIDRVHRISREINDRLRSSSLRRSKNNGDATDGAAANGGTDALVDSAVRRMSKEPEPPRA
ncbi:hypothetical protein AURANDRAFT_67044 [Aureococcus anophagefferens]|uniref:Cyclic nucleotide-binding domain-containing protein n=1 Tax=Aureococcus anophagefferens TaxID=44056 RepID=F0YJR6_AURAN|nr:hypothetical protein AURANDRAFT_67044 [Aureococcus anophagefferens]EGB04645.1 hypothetical protein AURANDRAFT_67044 [Aureococcus anophagefferens]|eukprot:XP_009040750.1 hypothetical protein AURANDRAFT_67044 [Aureococcus anophagefferens]